MSVIDGMVKEGRLTAGQAERAKKSANGLLKAAAADPAVRAELEKLAGPLDAMKAVGAGMKKGFGQAMETTVPQVATVALLTGMMSAGTDVAKDAYRALKSKVTENKNYQAMLEKNPSLRNHPDQEMIRDTFKTLHRFNPAYSGDPLVAGTFVQNAVDMERLDVNQVNQLVSAAKTIKDTGPKPTDLSPFALKMHMTPEQRLLHTYQTQAQRWQAEDNPALQAAQAQRQAIEHGWKVEDRPMMADVAASKAEAAQYEADKRYAEMEASRQMGEQNVEAARQRAEAAQYANLAAQEAYAADAQRRQAMEDIADMAADVKTNKDWEAFIAGMRPPKR